MRRWLKFRGALFLLAVLVIIGVGLTYAVQIQREVSGSVIIGRVETVDETILVWKAVTPAKEPLTQLEFGTGDINAFGLFKGLPLIPVWVENGGYLLRAEGRAGGGEGGRESCGRCGLPHLQAHLWACSDDAGYINGQVSGIDGGLAV